jgi:hypothetical protein
MRLSVGDSLRLLVVQVTSLVSGQLSKFAYVTVS